jgi:hypothetical protein
VIIQNVGQEFKGDGYLTLKSSEIELGDAALVVFRASMTSVEGTQYLLKSATVHYDFKS